MKGLYSVELGQLVMIDLYEPGEAAREFPGLVPSGDFALLIEGVTGRLLLNGTESEMQTFRNGVVDAMLAGHLGRQVPISEKEVTGHDGDPGGDVQVGS